MSSMNEIEEVKARLDIADIVGQYVQLQKAGRSFKAPCPFHNERTPSFIVSPDRQSWHCFGACGTGGDVISFVMRKEGMEFPDALKMLAERVGVKLRERHVSEQEDKQRERLYAANEAAAQWYKQLLLSGDAGHPAREYIERRGIDTSTADTFTLGYSAPSWEAAREHLLERGFSDAELLKAGLLLEGESGMHDRFRGRLMFPIRDAKGRLIGFGARALDDSLPKYLNTAQTAVFDKSGVLYALDRAQAAIRRDGRVTVVEGYMDAIAAHQHGFDNVVASMGTALTERQVRLLKRLTSNVVLALDADAAGSEAAIRGHDVAREALTNTVPIVDWRGLVRYQQTVSVELRVAVLPAGRDPDDVIRADPETWRALIENAAPVLDYRLETSVAVHDLSTPLGRSQLAREFLPLLGAVTDPVVRANYLQKLSRLSGANERDLNTMLAAAGRQHRPNPTDVPAAALLGHGDPREEFLLALLLQYPDLRPLGVNISEELLWESENRQLMAAWKGTALIYALEEESETVNEIVSVELRPHLERLFLRKLPDFNPKEAEQALVDCRQRLERRQLEAEKQAIGALLAAREEELGLSVLTEAALSETGDDERVKEVVGLHIRDMETGLKLHGRDRIGGADAVEKNTDG
jgi:DNA primase